MVEPHPTPISSQFKDLAGQRFGLLTARNYVGRNRQGHSLWRCECDCGNANFVVAGTSLHSENTRSCGCLKRKLTSERSRTHGMRHTPEYRAWRCMLNRCYRPTEKEYENYGGRGIRVCDGWREPHGFTAFLADVGLRPGPKYQLDRLDNDGGYEPGNVRWRTKREQVMNRSDNRRVTVNGETLTVTEWSERTGINVGTIFQRIYRGWPSEYAVTLATGAHCPDLVRPPGVVERDLAMQAVRYAVKTGRLVKPGHCQTPGCVRADVQAHHHKGYSREHRLDVVWLCHKHHYAADRS
jgi:hypothetical protein